MSKEDILTRHSSWEWALASARATSNRKSHLTPICSVVQSEPTPGFICRNWELVSPNSASILAHPSPATTVYHSAQSGVLFGSAFDGRVALYRV